MNKIINLNKPIINLWINLDPKAVLIGVLLKSQQLNKKTIPSLKYQLNFQHGLIDFIMHNFL